MQPEEIKKLVRDEVQKMRNDARFSVSKVPFHVHNNLDAPQVQFKNILKAPNTFIVAKDTNGTTNVDVFNSGGAPYDFTITGVFLISKDTTAGNITVVRAGSTVCTIAKGTATGVLVGATSLSNTSVQTGQSFQVDSSTAGNATVFITYVT